MGTYMHYLHSHVLLPRDTIVAHGVAFQIADVWLSELARAVGPAARVEGHVVPHLLRPFVRTLAMSNSPAMLPRITYALLFLTHL